MSESQNEIQSNIDDALLLLIRQRDRVHVAVEHLKALCHKDPAYARHVIMRSRTALVLTVGIRKDDIAHMVRDTEWELLGAETYLMHYLDNSLEETRFIYEKLQKSPDDFTHKDLRTIVRNNRRPLDVFRKDALALLAGRVASFAEQITAEPPGLSQDISSLRKSIQDYGFGPEMNEVLQKIDEQLATQSDGFDQAATMRHIRSFFEKLHKSVGEELQRRRPNIGNGTPFSQCGNAIDYLERKGVTTEKLKNLARCIYAILSDGEYGVHALKATRDYTRLCRNMVVEYAVTLFFELERRLAEPGDE